MYIYKCILTRANFWLTQVPNTGDRVGWLFVCYAIALPAALSIRWDNSSILSTWPRGHSLFEVRCWG